MTNNDCTQEVPIFIVGMPRSGTTLISSILSAHSNLAVSNATHFLTRWMSAYQKLDLSKEDQFYLFWDNYSKSKDFSTLGIEADKVLENLIKENNHSYKIIFETILKEYAKNLGKRRWGEKTPDNYKYLRTLLTWYPEAKVIWMLRDPRGVIASLNHTPWAVKNTHNNAKKWQESIILFTNNWSTDKRVYLLKYEDFVKNQNLELRKICEFIEEEYQPEMLNKRSEKSSPIVNCDTWSENYLKETLRPISENSVNKWQSELSQEDITLIEFITKKQMRDYGYEFTNKNLINYLKVIIFLVVNKVKYLWKKYIWSNINQQPEIYNRSPN